jgi:hypothetical protein
VAISAGKRCRLNRSETRFGLATLVSEHVPDILVPRSKGASGGMSAVAITSSVRDRYLGLLAAGI